MRVILAVGLILCAALLASGCSRTITASGHPCIQVRFDAGGQRAIATARSVTRVSATTVILHDPIKLGGRHRRGVDQVEITSASISIMEGPCWPPEPD